MGVRLADMSQGARKSMVLTGLLLFAGCVFLTGINWGLPSRAVDPFLFGDRPVWTGKQILALTPPWGDDATRGADVAAHPLLNRDQPIVMNSNDADRAHIVLQYRLYSDQPDEMITLRALSAMRPSQGKLDPRLYQYGGLWIYPIGALVKVTLNPKADVAFYLDHPEAFGRMYVVMRLYTVMWALIGVGVVFALAARLSEGLWTPFIASLLYILMPVVVNMSHEAKPHLPGAVLALLAVWAASEYIAAGRMRWAIASGVACGASAAMVLSGATAFIILPVMVLLRRAPIRRNSAVITAAGCAGMFVYALTNPYVVIHLLGDHALLRSNLGNSVAMYQAPGSVSGFCNAAWLIGAGASPLLAIAGLATAIWTVRRRNATRCLLAAVAAPVIVQFFLLASGKPGEYARFAMLPDIILAIAAAAGVEATRPMPVRWLLLAALCLTTAIGGVSYQLQFSRDARERPTRLIAAEQLQLLQQHGAKVLAVDAEPAPYCLPPVNLFDWKIVLLPRRAPTPDSADARIDFIDQIPRHHSTATVESADRRHLDYLNEPPLLSTPISWAAKSFVLDLRQGLQTNPSLIGGP